MNALKQRAWWVLSEGFVLRTLLPEVRKRRDGFLPVVMVWQDPRGNAVLELFIVTDDEWYEAAQCVREMMGVT